MIGNLGQRAGRCLFVFAALLAWSSVATSSIASGAGPKAGVAAYYLPSQPLWTALETFARQSNREILYDGGLADGRLSSDVDGVYATETALEILLAGSGLEADVKDNGFFVLRPVSTPPQETQRREAAQQYYAAIQRALRTAFCDEPADRRVAARLWVGRSGDVLQVRTLGSTGEPPQAAAALLGMRIGPPPANFAQPITIVIQARTFESEDHCVAARSRWGARAP